MALKPLVIESVKASFVCTMLSPLVLELRHLVTKHQREPRANVSSTVISVDSGIAAAADV